jgi:hypothetical protein
MDIFNFEYSNRIIRKQEHNTLFLIDTHTGALFSESYSGIITFQNADGNKWLYTDNPINVETDIPHFTTYLENGATCINGMFAVFENKEDILQKAYDYFSKFLAKDAISIDMLKWRLFLN